MIEFFKPEDVQLAIFISPLRILVDNVHPLSNLLASQIMPYFAGGHNYIFAAQRHSQVDVGGYIFLEQDQVLPLEAPSDSM